MGTKAQSQVKQLARHLRRGASISPAEAREVYGIRRLAARVYNLTLVGWRIRRELRVDPAGSRYARYWGKAPRKAGK